MKDVVEVGFQHQFRLRTSRISLLLLSAATTRAGDEVAGYSFHLELLQIVSNALHCSILFISLIVCNQTHSI